MPSVSVSPPPSVDEAHASLAIIADEVAVELNAARTALEIFAEDSSDRGALQRFAEHLHGAYGALRVAEVYGGALLAEEMGHLARHVESHVGQGRADHDALDALVRGMEQLPVHVERVASGGRDLPIMLLPLLNDLRAAHGAPLLSEGTLLVLNLRSDEPARPVDPAGGEAAVAELIRRHRPRFQLALLGWIRGENETANLATLSAIAGQLEEHATTQPVFQLWWVVGAMIEALQMGGIHANVSVKRLLGHADRELRRLHELGERRYAEEPPLELQNNMLFYIGRCASLGPRVDAVRRSFHLDELLAQGSEAAEEGLSAPSVRLMKTVAGAIREDLTRVKDVLDIFVRKGATQVDELAPQVELLRKICDTLGVLGLGALRDRVQSEVETLQAVVDHKSLPSEQSLLAVAAALITVEDSLDSHLLRLIVPEAAAVAGGADEPTDEEFRQVQRAVLRECIVNMARIKEAVTHALVAPAEAQGLDQVPQLVRGISAGLLMLGKQRAVDVMESIGRVLGSIVRPAPGELQSLRMDNLADAIVAVEYYMEILQAGRADQWTLLEAAESRLAGIEKAPENVVQLRPAVVPSQAAATDAATGARQPATAATEEPARRLGDQSQVGQWQPGAAAPTSPATRAGETLVTVDPEFVSLFVEEARENIGLLRERFPLWERDPLDVDALRDVRRAFHTLKGSGRMVGAHRVGDFSWSIESLLNRVISETVARSPEIVDVVRDAIGAIPGLVDEIETGVATRADVNGIMSRADALSGREATLLGPAAVAQPEEPIAVTSAPEAVPAVAEIESAPVAVAAAEPEEAPSMAAPPDMDPVLRDIFRNETQSHIQVVREYIDRCGRTTTAHPITDALYRACHTLSGIAKTAGARQGIKVAEPMEQYVRKLYYNGHRLPDAGLAMLRDTVRILESVSENVSENTAFFPEQGRVIAGWHALDRALDVELVRLAEAAEKTVADMWQSNENLQTVLVEQYQEPEAGTLGLKALMPLPPDTPAPVTPSALTPMPVTPPSAAQAPLESLPFSRVPDTHPVQVPPPAAEGYLPGEFDDIEPDADYDPDIAAIFGEEATELLEQAEGALLHWTRDRNDYAHVTELKRLLHTLKGGARMAGIRSMGDVSHELETLLGAVEHGTARLDDEAIELVQTTLDELQRMRDMASAGQRIQPARALLARIRALASSGAVQPAVPAPSAPPPAVTPSFTEPVTAAVTVEPTPAPTPSEVVTLVVPTPEAAEPVIAELPAEQEALPELEVVTVAEQVEPVTEPEALLTVVPAAPEIQAEVQAAAAPLPPTEEEMAFTPVAPVLPELVPVVESAPVSGAEVAPDVPAVESAALAEAEVAPVEGQAPVLPGREPTAPAERSELARVDAELLDELLNNAGEVSIFRARIEQQMTSIEFNLAELDRTVTRLRAQLRKLELETEAQILHRHLDDEGHRSDFDPLELDRYSTIQQLSRALAESVSDVGSIEGLLENLNRETQNLLLQQGRVVTELQNGLMRTRMVPFQRYVQRLTRIARQVAQEEGKRVELQVEGGSGEIDRQVLERMLPPFEHMMRNAVVHGIESPQRRVASGKSETGRISVRLQREGAEVIIIVEDDGAGLDTAAIRAKARQMGLLRPEQQLTDEQALQLILEPGFSTATRLTQQAGRGVGMDVVATEVKKLGGGLFIESMPGQGARFTIRLPFTLAITQALLVRVQEEIYALPMATVEGVARLQRADIERHLAEEHPSFEYGGNLYRFQHLGTFLGAGPSLLPENDTPMAVVLVRAGEHSTALVTDELIGSREIVVKSVGPQISSIRGISGATILGDGRIVVILDMGTLVRSEWRSKPAVEAGPARDERIFALIVDDSITVRRVTQRLLERNGMRVMTARDGVEALEILQENTPDVILLDIEMPRMDGYEVAAQVRADERLVDVPIIMITSRVGEKHRARAIEIGIDDYLGKPYQESQLLDAIEPLVMARRGIPG